MKSIIAIFALIFAIAAFPKIKVQLPAHINSETLIDNVSKEASYTTDAYVLRSPYYSVFSKWTDTGAATWSGTVRLQSSQDGTNWENIAGSDITMSGSGTTSWNVSNAGYLYGRLQGVYSAGSATIYVQLNTK